MDSLPLSHLRSISSEEAQIIRAIHSFCLQYSCWVSLELCIRSQRFWGPIWRLFLQHLREASSKLAKLRRFPCKHFWCHWLNGPFCSRWMQARVSQEMLYKVCITIHTAELVVGMQRGLELRCEHPEQQSSPRSLGKWPSSPSFAKDSKDLPNWVLKALTDLKTLTPLTAISAQEDRLWKKAIKIFIGFAMRFYPWTWKFLHGHTCTNPWHLSVLCYVISSPFCRWGNCWR